MKRENKTKKAIAAAITGVLITPTAVPAFAETVSSSEENQSISKVKTTTPEACQIAEIDDNNVENKHLTKEQVESAVADMADNYKNSTSPDSLKCFYKYEEDKSVSPKERSVSVNSVKEDGYEELMKNKLVLQDAYGNKIKDVKWYAYSLENSKLIIPEDTESSPDSNIVLHEDGSFTAKPLSDTDKSQGVFTIVFGEYNGSLYYFCCNLKTLKDSKTEIAGLEMDKIVNEHSEWKTLPKHKAALKVHDYIIEHVYYPNKYTQPAEFNKAEKSDSYVYYAFIKGYAVCNGYAKAYQALLKRIGINAEFVSGDMNPESVENTAHAWNIIQLEDDKWYLVDVTWDDKGDYGSTQYFLMDMAEFDKTHKHSVLYNDKEFGTIYLNNGNIQNDEEAEQTPDISYNKDTTSYSKDGKLSCEVKVSDITDSKVEVLFNPTKNSEYDSYGFYIFEGIGSRKKQIEVLGQNTKGYTFKSDGLYTIEYIDSKYASPVVIEMNIKLGYQPSAENNDDSNKDEIDNNIEEVDKNNAESTDSKEDLSENNNSDNKNDSVTDDKNQAESDSNNENIQQDVKPPVQISNIPYNKNTKSYSNDGKLSCELKVTDITDSGVKVLFNAAKNSVYNRYAFFIYEGIGAAKKPIETLSGDTKYYTFKSDGLYTVEYTDSNYISPVINEINIKLDYKSSYNQNSNSYTHSSGSGSSGSSENKADDKSTYSSESSLKQTGTLNKLQTAEKKSGWNMKDGKWYYVLNDGTNAKGWIKSSESGLWYHMNDDGTMATNKWIQDSGKWYYLGETGAMKSGWIQNNGVWYFLNTESGAMQTGWIKSPYSGKWYYCNASGAMLTNTTINGYTLGADGAWIK